MFVVPRIVLLVAALIWMRSPLMADPVLDAVATVAEIRIENVMPYRGPLAAFGAIGKTAYFNACGREGAESLA
jgi:hypothetical protein